MAPVLLRRRGQVAAEAADVRVVESLNNGETYVQATSCSTKDMLLLFVGVALVGATLQRALRVPDSARDTAASGI